MHTRRDFQTQIFNVPELLDHTVSLEYKGKLEHGALGLEPQAFSGPLRVPFF